MRPYKSYPVTRQQGYVHPEQKSSCFERVRRKICDLNVCSETIKGNQKSRCPRSTCGIPAALCVIVIFFLITMAHQFIGAATNPIEQPPIQSSSQELSLCEVPIQNMKLVHCGKEGCGYDITVDSSRFFKKSYRSQTANHFEMLKQVYKRLNNTCLGIMYPVGFCDDGVIFEHNDQYLSTRYKGQQIKNSEPNSVLDPESLLSLFQFGIESIAPCVAKQGLVFFDVTAQHMVTQNEEREPFQMYDIGLWRCREWYNSTVDEATKQNQHIIKQAFQRLLDELQVDYPEINSYFGGIPVMSWDQASCCWWGGQEHPWNWMWSKFEPEVLM